MRRLDIMTFVGLVLGVFLIGAAINTNNNMSLFINMPSIMITVGGSFAAVLIHFSFSELKGLPKIFANVLFHQVWDYKALASTMKNITVRAKKEGLLAIEKESGKIRDPFVKQALQLIVDRIDQDEIRSILEMEIAAMVERHKLGQKLFSTWGNFAPSFGMVGTLIGLIQMLSDLTNISKIGPGMAVALLTTFYGALMSYLVLHPIAGKLALRSDAEVAYKQMVVEAAVAIRSGNHPLIVEEKMEGFLAAGTRKTVKKREGILND